jgi:hypothetical protein
MAGVILNGSTSGSVTLDPPAVAGSTVITLPSTSGTMALTSVAPAFSSYQGSAQSISNAVFTKIQCSTEEFDTNNNYDNITNYRFTPTVSGYYQINGQTSTAQTTGTLFTTVYKNGVEFKRGSRISVNFSGLSTNVSALIYLNGTTDYVELYIYQDSGTTTLNVASHQNYFQASMVRSA